MTDVPSTSKDAGGQAATVTNGSAHSTCPPHVLEAIYGKIEDKKAAYENSLRRWWGEYADRKNDEADEYVANSLLYDRRHLPRTAPAPDCVTRLPTGQPQASQLPQEGQQQ